jgi:hypothetical protein
MEKTRCYDIFLTHAWRFHDDWSKFSELLNKSTGFTWRNFSLPWHDPAMSASTEVGGRFIRDFLERQIIPVHAVVLLAGVHAIQSARVWVESEVEMARRYRKPVIGVPPSGQETVADDVRGLCDACCGWDAAQLAAAIDQVGALPKLSRQA